VRLGRKKPYVIVLAGELATIIDWPLEHLLGKIEALFRGKAAS